MMRLLVTAISGNVATGVLHSLSEYEYHLFGCDVGKYPAGIDLVEDFFVFLMHRIRNISPN